MYKVCRELSQHSCECSLQTLYHLNKIGEIWNGGSRLKTDADIIAASSRVFYYHLDTHVSHMFRCNARSPLRCSALGCLTLPAHIILTVFGPTTLYGGITQYPASSISHGCRYSCWNFMKLQHYFHILLTSRSKSSRTKSIHGLRRNQPITKTCIQISRAVDFCPPSRGGGCARKLHT